MPALVAIALDGPEFVDALTKTWGDGDAVLPVDTRLPAPARQRLLDRMHPALLLDRDGSRRLADATPTGPQDALVVATSGSTGEPKGVVLTHAAVRASAEASSAALEVTSADHWLACLPLAHVGGLSVVTRALHAGTGLTVHDRFDAEAAMSSGATLISLVPTALARLDPTRFRRVLLGGTSPPGRVAANVVVTYGMTETGSGVVYDGRPIANVEVRVDPSTGAISVRGPMLLRCYRDGHDPKDHDGWLATGDVGSLDGQGRLVVSGRADDLIITGGENVWPSPVEVVIGEMDEVADVAVIGIADEVWGQRVVAVVVPTPAGPPTLDQIRARVRAVLPAHAAPKELRVVDVLARTALGKIRRSALAREAGSEGERRST